MVASKRPDVRGLERGATVGSYVIEAILGEGAVGVVYLASSIRTGDRFAVKILRAELAGDSVHVRRFQREAEVGLEVAHPNLLPVVETGIVNGCAYHATPYVSGHSLKHRLECRGPLPPDQTVRMAGEIGSALDLLHSRQLVHRDVKPANILIGAEGTALLADFGLVKGAGFTVLTRTGLALGTVGYMAPELIRGMAATPACDVYSLACVVFECLVGSPPFGGDSELEIAFGHLDRQPPDPLALRPELPLTFSEPLRQGLAKDPLGRPESVRAFINILQVGLTGEAATT